MDTNNRRLTKDNRLWTMDDGQWTMDDHDYKHSNQTEHGRLMRKMAVATNKDKKRGGGGEQMNE